MPATVFFSTISDFSDEREILWFMLRTGKAISGVVRRSGTVNGRILVSVHGGGSQGLM